MEGVEADGGPSSEAPSESWDDFYDNAPAQPQSSAAPYAAPALEQQPTPTPTAVASMATSAAAVLDDATTLIPLATGSGDAVEKDDDNDSSSEDMDLSEPSQPATPELPPLPVVAPANSAAATVDSSNHTGAKRKLDHVDDADRDVDTVTADEQSKKRKISDTPREVSLPAAVWQRIFMFCSPASLCRLLRVTKELNHILTGIKAAPASPKDKSAARIVDSETIWTNARKIFFPQLPRPLSSFSELDMLKLLGGKTCQFCGRLPVPPPATSVFNCGPGHLGVRVLFPFGVRTCGLCIEPKLLKDVELLGDPSIARLRLGLPHAFRSPDFHFATESVRALPGAIPGHLRFAKVHYAQHLRTLQSEEEDAKSLGEGAADEWRKGLFTKGKDAMADSARWEKWEIQLRLGADLAQVLREYDPSSFSHTQSVQDAHSKHPGVSGTPAPATANGTHPLPQPVHVFQNGYGAQFQHYQQTQYHQLPFPPTVAQQQHYRHVKNPKEVEEARQTRKLEIERRCQQLEPPVEPNVLQHMESFQAAMQITTPMTDAAWEMLKPRILAQRESAELHEHERASTLAALQASIRMPISEDIISKPARETYDQRWQDAQMPLRKKLAEYADDVINGKWKGGKMLERDNIPIFAVQVLLHVKQQYDEDKKFGLLDELEPQAVQTSAAPGTPPPVPFLSLDNMKWVYENKVRPFTDIQRKEHFICAGCDEKKPKWFAFEGLIQHYGAKHTSDFSKGNIIVHWETAEWPETPPFNVNPISWLKPDRRSSDFRNPGRARNTPQGHDRSFHAPSAGYQPAPYSNGYHNQSPGYPPSHYGQVYPAVPTHGHTNGYFSEQRLPAKPQIGASHDEQLNKLSADAREVWDAIQDVTELMEPIKIQTVIHHTVARFKETFHHAPVLDLLTDALAASDDVRPLKHVSGLACKTCVSASANANQSSYWSRIKGLKLYNTSSLITHFKLMHQPEEQMGRLDWSRDMIEVPESKTLRDVMRIPGMNDDKLAVIAAAFPSAFAGPLPKIGTVTEVAAAPAPVKGLLERLAKKQQKAMPKKKAQKRTNGGQDRDSSQDPLPEAKEDEYDPSRPGLMADQAPDPAQFDTDARKPPAHVVPPPQPVSAGTFHLNPETLAALQNLGSMAQLKAAPANDRVSRSPSVGHAEPSTTSRPPASAPRATPSGQPDIAAILASLTGNTAAAPAPTTSSNRPVSASRQQHFDNYGKVQQEPSPVYQSEAHRPSSRYGGPYPTPHLQPAVSHEIGELQAALSHNSRQYEQNQHQHQVYREAVHPGAAPASAPAHSPPQYQYVYEDGHAYGQPPAHTPVYREAPIQYIRVSEREYVPPGYQYERPASKPIYVDQNGRPLIPVDSAPAPAQYAPNPYEHQQYARAPEQHVYAGLPQPPQYQVVYDDRQPVYYEHVVQQPRYAPYDDGRASVPRPG